MEPFHVFNSAVLHFKNTSPATVVHQLFTRMLQKSRNVSWSK